MEKTLTGRMEAHLWFEDFDEYAKRKNELVGLLKGIPGNGCVLAFFRDAPEYVELQGCSFDYRNKGGLIRLIKFCGVGNIDFVARVSNDTGRGWGRLRGKGDGA